MNTKTLAKINEQYEKIEDYKTAIMHMELKIRYCELIIKELRLEIKND